MPSKKANSEPFKPKVVLAVAAHPDDIDFAAAGAIAKWTKEGADVFYLVCTKGCKGSDDHKITSEQLSKIRQNEQLAAAKLLEVRKVFFLGHTDGELEPILKLKEEIVRIIRKTKPDTVITFDPKMRYSENRGYINHPDHIAAGEATLAAVFPLARDRLNFPQHEKQGLAPHKVRQVLLFNLDEPNFFVDITNTLDKKFEALRSHKSQVGNFSKIKKMVTGWASTQGKKAKVKYAEGFKRITIEF